MQLNDDADDDEGGGDNDEARLGEPAGRSSGNQAGRSPHQE